VDSKQSRSEAVDYTIWTEVQQWLHHTKVFDIDKLKECVLCLVRGLEQNVMSDAGNECHERRRACIHVKRERLSIELDSRAHLC